MINILQKNFIHLQNSVDVEQYLQVHKQKISVFGTKCLWNNICSSHTKNISFWVKMSRNRIVFAVTFFSNKPAFTIPESFLTKVADLWNDSLTLSVIVQVIFCWTHKEMSSGCFCSRYSQSVLITDKSLGRARWRERLTPVFRQVSRVGTLYEVSLFAPDEVLIPNGSNKNSSDSQRNQRSFDRHCYQKIIFLLFLSSSRSVTFSHKRF